jgi:hypothetical protein
MLDRMRAVVTSFNRDTLVGIITAGRTELRFHSTSFQADSGFRWPRVGEAVEIVTNAAGNLLSVHGK